MQTIDRSFLMKKNTPKKKISIILFSSQLMFQFGFSIRWISYWPNFFSQKFTDISQFGFTKTSTWLFICRLIHIFRIFEWNECIEQAVNELEWLSEMLCLAKMSALQKRKKTQRKTRNKYNSYSITTNSLVWNRVWIRRFCSFNIQKFWLHRAGWRMKMLTAILQIMY